MNTLILDGVDVTTSNMYVLKLSPVLKAEMRIRRIIIPGRSGHVTEWDGDYEGYLKDVELLYQGNNLNAVLAVLQDARSAVFGNDPGYAYDIVCQGPVKTRRHKAGDYRLLVTYLVQPLKRLATETEYKDALSYSVQHQGDVDALPRIIVTGASTKTLAVGSQSISIAFPVGGDTITIDAFNGQIYDSSGDNAWDKVTGPIPVIPISSSPITVSTTGTGLTVWPNWRWR